MRIREKLGAAAMGVASIVAAAAAVLGVMAFAALVTALPARAAVSTRTADTAACQSAYHFHHVNAVEALYGDEELWQGTYAAALHTAREASQAVAGPVVHWLYEGTGWSAVRAACVPYMKR